MNMNRTIATLFLVVAVTLAAPGIVSAETIYGKGVGNKEAVAISAIYDDPASYVGKSVTVEGLIVDVCSRRGCWMSLGSKDEDFQEIRIKVDDGVIVFPMEAMGKTAIAEGMLAKVEMTLEQTVAYKQHHAEEHGEEFDPASVTEPLVYYQIKGTGAVIR